MWVVQSDFLSESSVQKGVWRRVILYSEKTILGKDTYTSTFIVAPFAIVKTWKEHSHPLTDEWIKKMWSIYIMECYSAIKRMK